MYCMFVKLILQKLYKEDWENDKDMIYYPVHITPGYEHALDASKFQSDVSLKLFYGIFSFYLFAYLAQKE